MIRFGLAALFGLALLLFGLTATPDLRGWMPADPMDRFAAIRSTPEGRRDFQLSHCMPGSIDRHASPRGREADGSATVSIMTCRSASSAITWVSLYGLLVLTAALLTWLASPRRRRRHLPPGAGA